MGRQMIKTRHSKYSFALIQKSEINLNEYDVFLQGCIDNKPRCSFYTVRKEAWTSAYFE